MLRRERKFGSEKASAADFLPEKTGSEIFTVRSTILEYLAFTGVGAEFSSIETKISAFFGGMPGAEKSPESAAETSAGVIRPVLAKSDSLETENLMNLKARALREEDFATAQPEESTRAG